MEQEGLDLPSLAGPSVFVVAIGEEARHEARSLVRSLREGGLAAQASLEDRPLKAQLRMADRAGATFAAILGEKELQDAVVTLRRMADGHQETVKAAELIEWVRG
jgi:histidyl-tRNA synthetase